MRRAGPPCQLADAQPGPMPTFRDDLGGPHVLDGIRIDTARLRLQSSQYQARPTRPRPVWTTITELKGATKAVAGAYSAVTCLRTRLASSSASAWRAATWSLVPGTIDWRQEATMRS